MVNYSLYLFERELCGLDFIFFSFSRLLRNKTLIARL